MYNLLFSTVCVPVFTPINEFNKVNFDAIANYFEYLYENGIRSLFINGGCGEFSSLTINERKQVLEKWIEVSKNDVEIVVNIGTTNLDDTIELGNHALSMKKIYCVAIVPPFYMPINNEQNLLTYLMSVAEGLSKEIPILYYHYPALSKVDIDIKKFLNLVKKQEFHQLAAIKYTDPNLDNFRVFLQEIKSNNLSINMFCGFDSLLYQTMISGGKGAVLGLSNIKPRMISAIIKDPESYNSASSIISDILDVSIKFSRSEKVSLMGLLKIATDHYCNLNLGPMKKPYVVDEDFKNKYLSLLDKLES